MTDNRYQTVGQAVTDLLFPEVDLALRRGCHICEEDVAWYTFLSEARQQLQAFYAPYGWDLVQRDEGFFYLLPRNDTLGSVHVSPQAMLVGQVCLLLYLDLTTTRTGGRVSRQHILEQLIATLGEEEAGARLTGKAGRRETRQIELVHQKLNGALRELQALGFVDRSGDEFTLRSTLVRFADPVRGDGNWKERLRDLVATGQVTVNDTPHSNEEDDETGADTSES